MKQEAINALHAAYDIEAQCILEMKDYIDDEAFSKAVELLIAAPRIGTCGCGHSGIFCQHLSHLLCCVEQPSRFISPAEAVHGATGFLQEGDGFGEHDVDDGAVADGLFHVLIADAGELEDGGGALDRDDVLAVDAGHDTVRRPHFHDAGSDDGLARFIGDGSPHRDRGHRRKGREEQCQGQTELMESFHTVGLLVMSC